MKDWPQQLAAVDVAALEEHDLRQLLRDVTRVRDAAEAVLARAAGRLGSSSAVRGATRCTQREADRAVARGELMNALPDAGNALSSGAISPAHVDALGRAAERTSPEAVRSSGLLAVACAKPADAMGKQVTDFVRKAAADADVAARRARQQADRRAVLMRDRMGVLHAEFDDWTFSRIEKAINAEMDRRYDAAGGRDRRDDAPTPQQRRADALAALILGESSSPGERSVGRRSARGRSAGPPPVRHQAIVIVHADGTGHLPGVGPLPRAEVERLCCISDLHGLVFSVDGRPLWLGSSVRLASDDQWYALIARDEGCIGCGADPSRCEAHHVQWVRHGGLTDIDNLVLVCSHCHHLIHDRGWRVLAGDDHRWSLVPP